MPLYDMYCDACDTKYELMIKLDKKPGPCPHCGHADPQKVVNCPLVAKNFSIKGKSGPIFDEREVISDLGANWRNPQNHTRMGGDRKAWYWDGGDKSGRATSRINEQRKV